MISICIPVYNFDVTSLVSELSEQIKALNEDIELILIDDSSSAEYKERNRQVSLCHTYIELTENIGRSRIRNLFLKYASHRYLLFLDCDCSMKSEGFLGNYLDIIKQNASIVCGGSIYERKTPGRDKKLRWKYGILRESKPSYIRNKFPNRSLMANNFLIDRNIFEKIGFDERINGYGYEDVLLGYSLKRANIIITHIDNPVVNGGLQSNVEYLSRTKEGIINLADILKSGYYDNDLINEVALLRIYYKIGKFRKVISLLFLVLKPVLFYFLSRGYVNLYFFDFYKLGLFLENYPENTQK